MTPRTNNPLANIRSADDIRAAVEEIAFFANTDASADPIWERATKTLLEALTFYICATTLTPAIHDVFRLLQYVIAPPCDDEGITPKSGVDEIFDNLKSHKGGVVGNAAIYEEEAIKAYDTFRALPERTRAFVVINAQVLLQPYVLQ